MFLLTVLPPLRERINKEFQMMLSLDDKRMSKEAEYLEGYRASCRPCGQIIELPEGERPLHPFDAAVADMPEILCSRCGARMLINWRNIMLEMAGEYVN